MSQSTRRDAPPAAGKGLPREIEEAILRDELAHTVVGRHAAEQLHGIRSGTNHVSVDKSLETTKALRAAILTYGRSEYKRGLAGGGPMDVMP